MILKSNIKKKDLFKSLSVEIGYSQSFSKKIIEDLIDCLKKNIKDNNLILKNFGSFKIIKKKERIGRNPKTKKEFIILPRSVVTFKSSKKLNSYLND
tara:strand:+ start:8319 stop:8609 length:291 start_codon:yes stop_codon:yes gene_type:complete